MKDLKRALEQAGRGCARSGKALTAPIGSDVCRIAAAGDGVHLWGRAELPPDKAGHRELLGLLGCLNRGEAGAPVFTLVDGQTVEAEARCARSPEAVLGALSRVEEVLGLLQDCAAGRLDSAAEQTRLAEEQRTAAQRLAREEAVRQKARREVELQTDDGVWEQLVHARWQELAPWPENAEPEWLCLQDCDRLSIQSKLDELSGAELVLCLLASDRALQRTRLQYVRAQLIRSGRLPADAAWPEGYGPEDAA